MFLAGKPGQKKNIPGKKGKKKMFLAGKPGQKQTLLAKKGEKIVPGW